MSEVSCLRKCVKLWSDFLSFLYDRLDKQLAGASFMGAMSRRRIRQRARACGHVTPKDGGGITAFRYNLGSDLKTTRTNLGVGAMSFCCQNISVAERIHKALHGFASVFLGFYTASEHGNVIVAVLLYWLLMDISKLICLK
jgi:hypothetical protein